MIMMGFVTYFYNSMRSDFCDSSIFFTEEILAVLCLTFQLNPFVLFKRNVRCPNLAVF